MVLLSAQGMDVPEIAEVAFTSEELVRGVIRNFNADGFDSLYLRYKGWLPAEVHLGPAPGDQEDRHVEASRA